MFNKPQYDYMCLIFNDNPFVINNRVTDLKLSAKELNLSGFLEEMINSAKSLEEIKQSFILGDYERQRLMGHFSEFSKVDLFTYLRSFQNVLKRGDNIKKTNYLNTFGYDGRDVISESQLLEAHMTFCGVNSFIENDYLNLIGLTSKFADS